MIRLAAPLIEDDDCAAVLEALRSGMLVQGPRVARFEELVASVTGTSYAVAVSSGTAALHLSLMALEVGPGDRVVVPAYSWPATANVVEQCGARPIFVDVTADTFAMDPDHLRVALANAPARAVIPVHPFGQMADMPSIAGLAAAAGAALLEDAACAFGAESRGLTAGSAGALGCFSFHPRKAVTTGEGGVVTTSDQALARQIRMLRNHGLDPTAATPDFVLAGLNYRMTEIQAALGESQVNKLDRILRFRRERALHYDELLAPLPIAPPVRPEGSRPTYQSYVVLLPAGISRDSLIRALRQEGIETQIGTYHIPLTRFYREKYGFSVGDFPVADDIFQRAVTLPLSPSITPEDQLKVVNAIAGYL